MLRATRLVKAVEKKEYSDEHCEQGTCDTQTFNIVANDGNSSRPDAEKNEKMPAPKQCGGKNRIPKGRSERFIMSKGIRKIRTVGGVCHRGLSCMKRW